MTYTRVGLAEREEISRMLNGNLSFGEIARRLNRSVSTISREVNRHGRRTWYRCHKAQSEIERARRRRRRHKKLDNTTLQNVVARYVSLRWSPEQIASELKSLYPDNKTMQVSHETIYNYVYVFAKPHLRRHVVSYLRRKHKYRRVKNKERQSRSPIQDYVSIDQRPIQVDDRRIPGHWEGDLIVGAHNASAIGTLVERTTRYAMIVKLKAKDAASVRQAFEERFESLPDVIKLSLTYDQGQEMAQHREFTRNTNIAVYFAHPHSPWERGTSENTNGLIRDFFPRGTDFNKVPDHELHYVETILNERIRKTLGWKSPKQAFFKLIALET